MAKGSLIVFGCGYVGTEFASQAMERGCEVTTLTRNPDTVRRLEDIGISRVIEGELDSDTWHPAIDNHVDFVLNCVGSASMDPAGYRKSYIDGQRSIREWARGGSIGTFVYTSSTSLYRQSGGRWVCEAGAGWPLPGGR